MTPLKTYCLLLAWIPALLGYPGGSHNPGPDEKKTLAIEEPSSDAAILNGAGGETTVQLTAKANWTLASDASWITVSAASGKKGHRKFTITTVANNTDTIRTGVVTLSSGGDSKSLVIRQRPYIFVRKELLAEGDVTNNLIFRSYGTMVTRIYSLLRVPESNIYQDISDWSAIRDGKRLDCPDGVNQYLATNIVEADVPGDGGVIASETFHVKAYKVVARLSLIKDIPPYDPSSIECREYLGKEANDVVDPKNPEIVQVSNMLWEETSGDLIGYARKCYEWTASSFTYGNPDDGLLPIKTILKRRIADCENFSSVFISLLRAKGIPARHVNMMSPWEKKPKKTDKLHARAEFYIPAYGWIPADPTYKNSNPYGNFFGVFTGPFVVMSRGINNICQGPEDANVTFTDCSHYRWWYWSATKGGNINIEHQFLVRYSSMSSGSG